MQQQQQQQQQRRRLFVLKAEVAAVRANAGPQYVMFLEVLRLILLKVIVRELTLIPN